LPTYFGTAQSDVVYAPELGILIKQALRERTQRTVGLLLIITVQAQLQDI